jgi:hypothetical protein
MEIYTCTSEPLINKKTYLLTFSRWFWFVKALREKVFFLKKEIGKQNDNSAYWKCHE